MDVGTDGAQTALRVAVSRGESMHGAVYAAPLFNSGH
jgi:hypothetical protein